MKRRIFLIIALAFMLPIRTNAKIKAEETLVSMGECKITYYCSCEECSGPYGLLTSTGTHCEEGRTCAVDPDVIAYGTRIKIGDHVYVAEDCGKHVQGDHIDIYLDDHERTERLGIQYKKVYLVK